MTIYCYDTEFLEDGSTIELISIGIVCEDGREYYAVNSDMDEKRAQPAGPVVRSRFDGHALRLTFEEIIGTPELHCAPDCTAVQFEHLVDVSRMWSVTWLSEPGRNLHAHIPEN